MTTTTEALHTTYPRLHVTTWCALIRNRSQRIHADYCAIALGSRGYAVHRVLPSGRLGALVKRHPLAEVTR